MVLDAADVKRWVQPAPTTTTGLAEAFVDATSVARVVGLAVASLPLAPKFPISVSLSGAAAVVPDGTVFLLPNMIGAAQAAIESSCTTISNVFIPNAEALAPIATSNTVEVAGFVAAYMIIVAEDPAVPVVDGVAELEFDDFGGGNVPIFPVKFPWRFTDNPENIQDAGAELEFTGTGTLDAVAGYADADFTILTPADALTPSVILEFPLTFPYQFNDGSFSVKRGYADVIITGPADIAAIIEGDAQAGIESSAVRTNSAFFPLVFPVQLQEIVALATAEITAPADVGAVVEGEGAVDVYTVCQVELGE